jgi:hypothetical protein
MIKFGGTIEAMRSKYSASATGTFHRYMYCCIARSEGTVEQLCELVVTLAHMRLLHSLSRRRLLAGELPLHWFEYPGTRHLLNLVETYPDLNSQQANVTPYCSPIKCHLITLRASHAADTTPNLGDSDDRLLYHSTRRFYPGREGSEGSHGVGSRDSRLLLQRSMAAMFPSCMNPISRRQVHLHRWVSGDCDGTDIHSITLQTLHASAAEQDGPRGIRRA